MQKSGFFNRLHLLNKNLIQFQLRFVGKEIDATP